MILGKQLNTAHAISLTSSYMHNFGMNRNLAIIGGDLEYMLHQFRNDLRDKLVQTGRWAVIIDPRTIENLKWMMHPS